MKASVNMVPMQKGQVCVHERTHYATSANTFHATKYVTLTIAIVVACNANGLAVRVADAASGSVHKVGADDRLFLAAGVSRSDVECLLAGRHNAEVESLAEAKELLAPLRK